MQWRRLLYGLTAVNVILVAAVLSRSGSAASPSTPNALRARSLELVDDQGRIRAQLTVERDGEAVFRLRDSRGEIRLKLGAGEDGSGLLLLDGSTEPRIHLLANDDEASLTLVGEGGRRRLITP